MREHKRKRLAPCEVRTRYEACLLNCDNIGSKKASLYVNEGGVTIYGERPGEQSVSLTRADFLRFARWYVRRQSIGAKNIAEVNAIFKRNPKRPPRRAGRK